MIHNPHFFALSAEQRAVVEATVMRGAGCGCGGGRRAAVHAEVAALVRGRPDYYCVRAAVGYAAHLMGSMGRMRQRQQELLTVSEDLELAGREARLQMLVGRVMPRLKVSARGAADPERPWRGAEFSRASYARALLVAETARNREMDRLSARIDFCEVILDVAAAAVTARDRETVLATMKQMWRDMEVADACGIRRWGGAAALEREPDARP